ncbi:TetR family transcriptional regulator [Deinococcus piscis]|uniref:TetR family transcriptional regulator n=1 Tax=Deinococcus piscis TaxID=394230 RepID=A0ABQ3K593_9DEIO|nr:TetR/AcrR family transcriptional regulator [Deinococcus piscis]GHG02852.1 TetR family transcriptional regulator [Deinococcus piscis]
MSQKAAADDKKTDGKPAPQPDPARSLALLWGSHTRPGRNGLTIRAIVEKATELADAEGLAALSMRRVAEVLGVGTMTLYSYVPGKDDLTDLMADRLMGTLYSDPDEPKRCGHWRDALLLIAERNWQLHLKHPWLAELVRPRPRLGPNLVQKYDTELRPLDGIGLSDIEMDALLTNIMTQVEGAARLHHRLEREKQDSAQTDEEWWLTQAPVLDRLLDAQRFPVAARVGQSFGDETKAAAAPEMTLKFGLELLLDGVEKKLGKT